jgi:serine/threonine protein kinase
MTMVVNEARLADLLLQWEAARECGRPVSVEELCRACPECEGELRVRAEALGAIDSVLALGDQVETPSAGAVPDHEAASTWPRVPDYDILGVIDRGGLGIVYKARHLVLNRLVALKTPRGRVLARPAALQRFHQEASLLAQLEHEHIVRIYDARVHEGQPYFAMQLVAGGTLAAQLAKYASPRLATNLMECVARAVHFAHERGILHRDLKPSNVLLDRDGKPLVSDFGLAKYFGPASSPEEGEDAAEAWPGALGASADVVTRPGHVMGTLPYMAPELLSGEPGQASRASDVWALGVILYELLTGVRPFGAGGENNLVRQIQTEEPVRPRKLRPGLGSRLKAVVLRCLEKQPSRRYSSAAAVADALAATRGSRRRVLWVTVAAVILAAIGFGWLSLLKKPPPQATPEEEYRKAIQPLADALARGEPVDLIPTGKTPRAWFPREGGDAVKIKEDGESGSFVVFHPYVALLELLPEMPAQGFMLRAEMRHEYLYAAEGRVGIYFAYSHHESESGPCHCFTLFGLVDPRVVEGPQLASDADRNRLHVHQVCFSDAHTALRAYLSRMLEPLHFGEASQHEWHEILAKVQPRRVEVICDGRRLGAFDHAKGESIFQKQGPAILAGVHKEDLNLPITGGLGIAVRGSSIAVRRLSVEPLP